MSAEKKEKALTVKATCNRCSKAATYEVGTVVVHPDLTACTKEGWDGLTFDRVIVCKSCGAEDDYTLATLSRSRLVMSAMASMIVSGNDATPKVCVGIAGIADRTPIRRASDAIRIWRERSDRDLGDTNAAWRLGNVYSKNGMFEQAEAAWRRAMAADPKEIQAGVAVLSMLIDHGRTNEGTDLPGLLLHNLQFHPEDDGDREDVARIVTETLRGAAKAGQPVALDAFWQKGKVGDQVTVGVSSIDLRRVTRWDHLMNFIARRGVSGLALRTATPDDHGTQLEALIEGGEATKEQFTVDKGLMDFDEPMEPMVPFVRSTEKIGRNDPCHCGSGKKFKKCHGA